jgi:serine/threonine protein kinase
LRHPNIVTLMAACVEDNNLWLVLEYADEGSLHDYLHVRKKLMSLKDLVKTSIQIAEGMVFVHEMNIIHLDLKSKNILLGKGGIKVQ